MDLQAIINGKKTYIVSALMIVYAILGFWLGQLPQDQVAMLVFNALVMAGLRHGVSKNGS